MKPQPHPETVKGLWWFCITTWVMAILVFWLGWHEHQVARNTPEDKTAVDYPDGVLVNTAHVYVTITNHAQR